MALEKCELMRLRLAIVARQARFALALYMAIASAPGGKSAEAQGRGGRGGAPAAPPTARAVAPIDLTGYWTAVITEDWHVRMLTAPRGDFGVGAPARSRTRAWASRVSVPIRLHDRTFRTT